MSYKWPSKDSNEELDYNIDWSRLLRTGETITAAVWYVNDESGVKQAFTPPMTVNGLTAVDASNSGTVATIQLGNGTTNLTYKLYCSINTSTGATLERSVTISIKER